MTWDYSNTAIAFWRDDLIVIQRVRDGKEFEFPAERMITSCLDELGLSLYPEKAPEELMPFDMDDNIPDKQGKLWD